MALNVRTLLICVTCNRRNRSESGLTVKPETYKECVKLIVEQLFEEVEWIE